ncbi:glycosyltransferase family 25 protein [Roseicyclus sp.]
MDLYVVAHPKFSSRYKYICEHLQSATKATPRFVGIVGADALRSCDHHQHRTDLTPGQIGCALSHVNAYREIVNGQVEKAVVVEDDAVLPPDFDSTVSAIMVHLREGEIISLHSPNLQQRQVSQHGALSIGRHRIFFPMEAATVRSALCYIIHKEAALRLLKANQNVKYLADDFSAFWEEGFVKHLRIASPQIVKVAGFESTIGYHGSAPRRIIARLVNKIPFMSRYLEGRRMHMRLLRDNNHVFVDQISQLEIGNKNYE